MKVLNAIKRNVTKVALGATVCQLGLMGGNGNSGGMGCNQAAQLFATGMELGYQAQTGDSLFSPNTQGDIFGESSSDSIGSESDDISGFEDAGSWGFDDESLWG
ncbi:hypothetical protein RAS1_18680 [Phycisphaerae bacterium RAS1]|nr:hypothetical protein RAS1_18680 [Phycisphaerae bacterium RAS1]